jgi:hypothetical protein
MKKKVSKKVKSKKVKSPAKKARAKQVAGKAGTCGKWSAVHDFMPPGPARLRVHGVCTFPTPGYKVTLKRHVPQGFNPAILILDKTVKRPTGIRPPVVTKVDAKFETRTDMHYTGVQIVPDGIQIKVQEVH